MRPSTTHARRCRRSSTRTLRSCARRWPSSAARSASSRPRGAVVALPSSSALLVVGGFLFLGEWLFGSMGWGIIHGTLLGVAVIGVVAVNLGGGSVRSYAWGLPLGVIVAVARRAVLLQRRQRPRRSDAPAPSRTSCGSIASGRPRSSGFVVGAVVLAIVALFLGTARSGGSGRRSCSAVPALWSAASSAPSWRRRRTTARPAWSGWPSPSASSRGWSSAAARGSPRLRPEARYAPLVPRRAWRPHEETRDMLSAGAAAEGPLHGPMSEMTRRATARRAARAPPPTFERRTARRSRPPSLELQAARGDARPRWTPSPTPPSGPWTCPPRCAATRSRQRRSWVARAS